jgi:ribonuclease HI
METITVNFDGGSRGNPGPAGIGVVLAAEDGTTLITRGKYVGNTTNNSAEYLALILGLRQATELGAKRIIVRGDSELVIKQMRGEYRVKNPALKQLFEKANELLEKFESAKFEHNLRHHNSLADRLANLAMDRKGDVDDIDEAPEAPPARESSPRLKCPRCGAQIEIKVAPAKENGRKFICPCGGSMS